jgi:hypothetical protein
VTERGDSGAPVITQDSMTTRGWQSRGRRLVKAEANGRVTMVDSTVTAVGA